jgi:predicted nucleic acid-binding protein
VTLILDAAPLIALADANDRFQPAVERVLRAERGALIIPAPVTAEVDYLLGQRLGRRARRAFLTDLAQGHFRVVGLDDGDYEVILALDEQYTDLDAGLADLAVVVLAGRFRTKRIVTFDERHFRTLRPLDGGTFQLLPVDEEEHET